jgi:hypothetical protein
MSPRSFAFDEGDSMRKGRSIHRVFLRCCILLGSFMVVSSTAAIADGDYPTSIINNSDSPVTLTKCEVWARDSNKTILYAHASIPNALIDLGVAFTNTSSKPVTVIRVNLALYDAFDTLLRAGMDDSTQNRAADKMSVAPGSSFDLLGPRSWHFRNDVPALDHVSCEINAVKFADGTVWTARASPSQQVTTPISTTSAPPPESSAPRIQGPRVPQSHPTRGPFLLVDRHPVEHPKSTVK